MVDSTPPGANRVKRGKPRNYSIDSFFRKELEEKERLTKQKSSAIFVLIFVVLSKSSNISHMLKTKKKQVSVCIV